MSTDTVHPPAGRPLDVERPKPVQSPSRGRIGLIVAASMAAGLVVAVALVAAPFIPARTERAHRCGAAGICLRLGAAGGAVGAVQRPTAALGGCAGRVPGCGRSDLTSRTGLGRPARCSAGCGHRCCSCSWSGGSLGSAGRRRSRTRRWLVYPLLAVLALSAIGGGYETVRESIDASRLPRARPADRRGRAPAPPELHRLRQPHRRPGARPRRSLLGDGLDRAGRGARTPESASTTAPVADGATPPTVHRTPCRPPPTCTRCWTGPTFPGPTCWPVTPSAASTSSPSPPSTPTRSPAWCCWTPPHPTGRRPADQDQLLRPRRSHLDASAGHCSPRGGAPDR